MQTDHLPNTLNPTYPTVLLEAAKLCHEELDRPIKVEAWDWNRNSDPSYIGEFVTNLAEILRVSKKGHAVSFSYIYLNLVLLLLAVILS